MQLIGYKIKNNPQNTPFIFTKPSVQIHKNHFSAKKLTRYNYFL